MEEMNHPTKLAFATKPLLAVSVEYTALLMIDMQYLDAHPDFGIMAKARALNLFEHYRYYLDRLEGLVIPNIQRLQGAFRHRDMDLIHVHIESLTANGRDRSPLYQALQIAAQIGSKEAEFIPEVAPQGDEIVIAKTSSSPFNSSNIDFVMRNLGLRQLVLTGVMTSGCVESTVRDAADLGYDVILVSDACAARTEAMEYKTHEALAGTFAHLMTTDSVLRALPATTGLI